MKKKKEPKLARVTSVLDFVESQWKEYWWRKVGFEAADKIGRDSAGFGTGVHSQVEAYLRDECGFPSDSNPTEKCAAAILTYLESKKIEPLFDSYEKSLEIEVKDIELGLIGHFDYAAKVDGVPTIIDFKTSNKMRKSFPLQKSAYAKMATKQLGIPINDGLTIRAHWDKDKQEVEFEEKEYKELLTHYWPIFNSCLDVYKYFK